MAVVSSCREMLGSVPQRAKPPCAVASIQLGTLHRLPAISWRKVGTTSSHHGPYVLGNTRATMRRIKSSNLATGSKSQKPPLSSDCRLQLACMKSESLVIAGQHTAVNTFSGLVHTARHTTEAGSTRSRSLNQSGESRRRWGR